MKSKVYVIVYSPSDIRMIISVQQIYTLGIGTPIILSPGIIQCIFSKYAILVIHSLHTNIS